MDFEKLESVSSEGLAALIQSKSRLRKLSGALRLVNVHGPTLEVFQLVHFDRLFELHPNIEEAAQQFAMDRQKVSDQSDDGQSDGRPTPS